MTRTIPEQGLDGIEALRHRLHERLLASFDFGEAAGLGHEELAELLARLRACGLRVRQQGAAGTRQF